MNIGQLCSLLVHDEWRCIRQKGITKVENQKKGTIIPCAAPPHGIPPVNQKKKLCKK